MSNRQGRVVVIGGGVIGAASAYYLMRSGRRATVLERGVFGGGSSSGNCGLVCPSHILPLAEPGAIATALRALTRRNSPFMIRPRLDPRLWSWLLQFAMRCNERDMMESGRGIQPLLESSASLYRELVESENLACEWERRGLLFVYAERVLMDAYAATDALLRDEFHCGARRCDGEELLELEPALKPGLAGGWYYEDDAHLRPDKLMRSLRGVLEAGGVEIREHCDFQGFAASDGKATAARTDQGEFEADDFVVATGALTPRWSGELGCRIPIQPGKGYSLTMPRPAICPSIPLIFPETRVAVTPFQSGYRLGSTMEFAGYDSTINPARLQLLRDGASPYLRAPYCEPVESEWYGWRPMTYDGMPVIDRAPALRNVMIAAGHNMIGLSMAPATGKLVAELLTGVAPHLDPRPYEAARFALLPR
ncbi:MAG: FAD-dependent oxidoreductase [Planctomycetota bacterium]|nr:FAD-dependent oxidoreductase [Planctomycetota bacterium]